MNNWQRFATLMVLPIVIGLQGCSEGGVGGTGGAVFPPESETQVALAPAGSSDAYADHMRDSLTLWGGLEAGSDGLRASLASPFPTTTLEIDVVPAEALSDSGAGGSDAAGAVSSTNLIVGGVDELDTVKYNGSQLFLANNKRLTVLDSDGVTTPSVLAHFELVGAEDFATLRGLYLHSSGGEEQIVALRGQSFLIAGSLPFIPDFGSNEIVMDIVDVSSPDAPRRESQIVVDGRLMESRRIDDLLVLVTQFSPQIDGYQTFAEDDEARERNSQLLAAASETDFIPNYRAEGEGFPLVDPATCLLPNDEFDSAAFPTLTTIAVFDLSSQDLVHASCLADGVRGVHVTRDSLYVVAPGRDDTADPYDLTAVHRFNRSGSSYNYAGTGELPGSFWGDPAFLMSEVDDRFVAITTESGTDEDRFLHRLSILEVNEQDQLLELAGAIPNDNRPEPIGKPNEQIFASRIFGDSAYVVTFEQVDPVYAIDLSVPTDPRITGELEIPGFSSYLHPISEGLLLGVGSNTDMVDGRLINDGVNVRLFDVSVEGQVTLRQEQSFGRRWSYSPVAFNYLAFTSQQISDQEIRFALPVVSYGDHLSETEIGERFSAPWTDTALQLFSVDLASSEMSYEGEVISEDHSTGERFQPGCCNWSMRSFLNDDAVLFLSKSRLYFADWRNPASASNTFIPTWFEQDETHCSDQLLFAPEPGSYSPITVAAYDRLSGDYLGEPMVTVSPVFDGPGSYSVTVAATGYVTRTIEDVRVQASGCSGYSLYVGVYLEPEI